MMADDKISKVASFYSGKSVFLTGGTGFVGKTLIEKLLFSCSEVDKIYVLIRDRDGKQARDRIATITSTPAFARLKVNRSKELNKIIPISGDVTRKDLGISNEELKTLEEEVSIVFHLAATVDFDLPLKTALTINVDGTMEVIQFCRRIKKLQAFVHVSTAFSNSDRSLINEVVYPMAVTLEHVRKISELHSGDEEAIKKCMGRKPNTYTLTKAFAEEVVMKKCVGIPTAIVRPSIIISSLKEPRPGWIDNWNGSTSIFVGMSSGTLKVLKGRGSNITDLVPVDIVTNLIIVLATECHKSKYIKVYNCCTGTSNPITCKGATKIARVITLKYSLNQLPWPILIFTPNVLLYNVLNFILQIIPACIMDLLSLILRRKAIQLKIQFKLRKAAETFKFFLLNQWKFSDDNMRALYMSLSDRDKEIFNFDVTKINWETCIQDYIFGSRKYLLHLDDKRLDSQC